jgi:hypothetical protein
VTVPQSGHIFTYTQLLVVALLLGYEEAHYLEDHIFILHAQNLNYIKSNFNVLISVCFQGVIGSVIALSGGTECI